MGDGGDGTWRRERPEASIRECPEESTGQRCVLECSLRERLCVDIVGSIQDKGGLDKVVHTIPSS